MACSKGHRFAALLMVAGLFVLVLIVHFEHKNVLSSFSLRWKALPPSGHTTTVMDPTTAAPTWTTTTTTTTNPEPNDMPLWLESLSVTRTTASTNNNNNPHARMELQSVRQLLHTRRRRLAHENRSNLLLPLEDEMKQAESLRHLSRYEHWYRLEQGLDLQLDWNGFYNHSSFYRLNQNTTKEEEDDDDDNGDTYGHGPGPRRLQTTRGGAHVHSHASFTTLHSGKFDNYQAIPLSQGYGTHIATVWVGAPKPQRKTVIVDTGSHYTAFPCKGCRNCGRSHHTDPYFNPARSETFRFLECDECIGVTCETSRCHFSQSYTEGSSWDAIQVKDQFYCGGSDVLDSVDPIHQKYSIDFMFGCMTKMSGLFLTQLADGIMGMSAHQATLPKQLWDKGLIEHNLFSMCYRRELGTSKRGVSAGSMTIGGLSTSLDTSPLVYAKNMARAGWFTVFVKNIYIRVGGGQSAAQDSTTSSSSRNNHNHKKVIRVRINPRTVNSGKGVIVDSGTTDTYLSQSAAPAFNKAWREATGKAYSHSSVKLTLEELQRLPTVLVQCHAHNNNGGTDPSIDNYDSIPGYTGTLDPSSPGDLLIAIPATSYMDYSPTTKLYTSRLYFTETAGGVLGSNTMQGHNVVFDWEHSRVGFAESSCSYDKSNVPKEFAEDSGYASDCQVQDPVLSRTCLESVDQPLCRFNQSNIALLGTEKWVAVVKNPGTRLGVTCVNAAKQMKVTDLYRDPNVSCNSQGICEEERPCQLTCAQVEQAKKVIPMPDQDARLKCGDSLWSACDRECVQTRIVSAAYSDGKCHQISRTVRPCHIDACAREDPCRAPYAVRVIVGLNSVHGAKWSIYTDMAVAESLSRALQDMDPTLNVLPGDVTVRMARSWFLDEDSPDALTSTPTTGDEHAQESTTTATTTRSRPDGVKLIVDISVSNNRTLTNTSTLEDDSDFEEPLKMLGNLSKHIVGELREVKCYEEDLFVLARRALAIKTTVLSQEKFLQRFLQLLQDQSDKDSKEMFSSIRFLNESKVVSAWSFRNGVDNNVNFLGPRKPWWFGIFRVVHFITVLITSSLVLWSVFGVIQNIYENGMDCEWMDYYYQCVRRRLSRPTRTRSSSSSFANLQQQQQQQDDDPLEHGGSSTQDEGVALVRGSVGHGSTSPKKRRGAGSRTTG